jgi:heme/copper-type cytochrome/quinol oxidase subunit 2
MNLSLAEAIFWVAALACVVAQIALVRSSLHTKDETRSELVPASSRSGELFWTMLPAIALSIVLFATWRKLAQRDEHEHMDHSAMSTAAIHGAPHAVLPRS